MSFKLIISAYQSLFLYWVIQAGSKD